MTMRARGFFRLRPIDYLFGAIGIVITIVELIRASAQLRRVENLAASLNGEK